MPTTPQDPEPSATFGPLADHFLKTLERPLAQLVSEILASPSQTADELVKTSKLAHH